MKKATYFYLLRRGFLGGGIQPIVREFQYRVLADGGTIEKIQCVSRAVATMPPFDFGRYTFDNYSSRVLTDGGAIEARTCTINAINNLN